MAVTTPAITITHFDIELTLLSVGPISELEMIVPSEMDAQVKKQVA
jgi:hypothetical protein